MRKGSNRRKHGEKGVAAYAILVGAVSLIGVLGLSVIGHKTADVFNTLAVILPDGHRQLDHLASTAEFIETTSGADDSFQIDSTRIGKGASRLNRAALAFQSSQNDS